jgi:hypothetical protein
MDEDARRAMEQYRGWTVEEIVALDDGAYALQIRSPDGAASALVTPRTALFGTDEGE